MIRVTIAVDGDVCEDLLMPCAPEAGDQIAVDKGNHEILYRVLRGRAWVAGDSWLLQLQADVDSDG